MIIEAVRKEKNYQKNYPVHYMEIASDDAWARDVGPTFVVNGQGRYGELTGVLMHGVESVTDCMQTGKR